MVGKVAVGAVAAASTLAATVVVVIVVTILHILCYMCVIDIAVYHYVLVACFAFVLLRILW